VNTNLVFVYSAPFDEVGYLRIPIFQFQQHQTPEGPPIGHAFVPVRTCDRCVWAAGKAQPGLPAGRPCWTIEKCDGPYSHKPTSAPASRFRALPSERVDDKLRAVELRDRRSQAFRLVETVRRPLPYGGRLSEHLHVH
jgi:hypothetical protein